MNAHDVIPFYPVDSPIPFRPRRMFNMPHVTHLDPNGRNFTLPKASDELAYLYELRDAAEYAIMQLKERILKDLGPLTEQHNELRGKASLWDIRALPTSTIAWKKIAEQLGPTKDLIAMHTQDRVQVSFKRVPLEVLK